MSSRLSLMTLLTLSLTANLTAQPEKRLATAIERLKAAGNYSWRETRTVETPETLVFPYAFGRTSIGGLTVATLTRDQDARAAFVERRAAIQIDRQWRRAETLTNDEIRRGLGVPFSGGNIFDIIRQRQHTCHHEILEIIQQIAVNIREEQSALVGELGYDGSAEAAVETLVRRGVFRPPPATSAPPGTKATFRVALDGADISRLTIDLVRPVKYAQGPRVGESYLWRRIYVTDFSEIGTSEVEITPELRAIFRGAGL